MKADLGVKIQKQLAECLGDGCSLYLEPYCLDWKLEIVRCDATANHCAIPLEVCALCVNHKITPFVQSIGGGSKNMRIILI